MNCAFWVYLNETQDNMSDSFSIFLQKALKNMCKSGNENKTTKQIYLFLYLYS